MVADGMSPATGQEIAFHQLDDTRTIASSRLFRCCLHISFGSINSNGCRNTTIEQLERQRTDPGPDVQERSACGAGADKCIAEEPCRATCAVSAVRRKISVGNLLRELLIRRVLINRT